MLLQTNIFDQPDFNQFEGNQKILDENRFRFSGQAKVVFEAMLSGEKVSSAWAHKNGIEDIRARVFGLTKKGVKISKEKIEGGHGSKYYFMSEQDRIENLKLITQ